MLFGAAAVPRIVPLRRLQTASGLVMICMRGPVANLLILFSINSTSIPYRTVSMVLLPSFRADDHGRILKVTVPLVHFLLTPLFFEALLSEQFTVLWAGASGVWRSNGDIEMRVNGVGGCVMLAHVDGCLGQFDQILMRLRLQGYSHEGSG